MYLLGSTTTITNAFSPSFWSCLLFFFTNRHRLRLPLAFLAPSHPYPTATTLPCFFLPRFFSIQRYSPPISTIQITNPFPHPPRIQSSPLFHPIGLPHHSYVPQLFHLPIFAKKGKKSPKTNCGRHPLVMLCCDYSVGKFGSRESR